MPCINKYKNTSTKYVKKNLSAFTLAEILIVVGIIGIIAEMTIPTLIQSTQNAEIKTGAKVAYSILEQATTMASVNNGGTLVTYSGKDSIKNYLKYLKDCSNVVSNGCWPAGTVSLDGTASSFDNFPGLLLTNGMSMLFYIDSTSCTSNDWFTTQNNECGWVLIDVNGFKKPNIIGKDSFAFFIDEGRITPWGQKASDCGGSGYTAGMACTYSFLYQ